MYRFPVHSPGFSLTPSAWRESFHCQSPSTTRSQIHHCYTLAYRLHSFTFIPVDHSQLKSLVNFASLLMQYVGLQVSFKLFWSPTEVFAGENYVPILHHPRILPLSLSPIPLFYMRSGLRPPPTHFTPYFPLHFLLWERRGTLICHNLQVFAT